MVKRIHGCEDPAHRFNQKMQSFGVYFTFTPFAKLFTIGCVIKLIQLNCENAGREVGTLFTYAEVRSMTDDGSGVDIDDEGIELSFGPGTLATDLQEAKAAEIAEYISASLVDLRKMALTFKMKFLVYLLEMAYQEAYLQAHPPNGGNEGR